MVCLFNGKKPDAPSCVALMDTPPGSKEKSKTLKLLWPTNPTGQNLGHRVTQS
jgi:hypothetical protein